jgi:hypothetical protein
MKNHRIPRNGWMYSTMLISTTKNVSIWSMDLATAKVTCMDFYPQTRLAVIGLSNGMVSVLRIHETEVNGAKRFILLKELCWSEKNNILDVSILQGQDE